MILDECEFGCECGPPVDHSQFGAELDAHEFQRLVDEKLARARHYLALAERLGGQIESD